ncbi:transglycosylase domain-containing protein [Streptomyces sp. NPDC002668]|uniref:transglycosylase domain-containing protein n=1 Tax=Streptomyces sp. NPDC002668 TaxID=3154422 RepID=UPI00331C0BD2
MSTDEQADGENGDVHAERSAGKRFADYPRRAKSGWRRWIPSWKLVTVLCLGFVGGVLGVVTVAYALVEVPNPTRMAQAQSNVYYWADGRQMASTGGEVNRQIIAVDQIPAAMQNAVISAQNKSFRTDSGVDAMGVGRALVDMVGGTESQGGSTITQQYVRATRFSGEPQSLGGKFRELVVSAKVGSNMEKSTILTGYLNTAYYGRDAYGVQAAAHVYYDKDARDLNVGECAFLATLLQDATHFDPAGAVTTDPAATHAANTARAEQRWAWILDEMVKDGQLAAPERARFTHFPIPRPITKAAKPGGQVGYLVDLATAYFLKNNGKGITSDDLARGGYEIHTTFDRRNVAALESAVQQARKSRINPAQRPDTDTHVQFGGASVNPATGAIVAVYGGEDAAQHIGNHADETGVRVGSAFTPFVLAAALRDGVRDPGGKPEQGPSERTIVDPDKSRYSGLNKLKIKNYDGSPWKSEKGEEWLQANDGGASYGDITLREAMVRSVNSPFVQLGMDIGIPTVRQAAEDAGLLKSSLNTSSVPSFSIGTSSPSVIRMATAYATFAADGQHWEPFSVERVSHNGRTVYRHEGKPARAFSKAVAATVTDVLRSVVDEPDGTGNNARLPGRNAAGRIGTTNGNKSAWFVGYTPQLSTAIDMYRLDESQTAKSRQFLAMYGTGGPDKARGGSLPSEIWRTYMTHALGGQAR